MGVMRFCRAAVKGIGTCSHATLSVVRGVLRIVAPITPMHHACVLTTPATTSPPALPTSQMELMEERRQVEEETETLKAELASIRCVPEG